MQLLSQTAGFKQEDRKALAPAWDRMKEAIRNFPNHGGEKSDLLFIYFIMPLTPCQNP